MVSRVMPDIESTSSSRKSNSRWRCFWMNTGEWELFAPLVTGSSDETIGALGGTKGGLTGAGGTGKSPNEERGLETATLAAGVASLSGLWGLVATTATLAAVFSALATGTVGDVRAGFLPGDVTIGLLEEVGDFFAAAVLVSALLTGFLTAGAGLAGLLGLVGLVGWAGLEVLCGGETDFDVIFFAAMAQRLECG